MTASPPAGETPLEALFREQRLAMVRLAHVITGSNEVAEEVVQEAFVRMHGRWPDIENPPAYLRTAVTNLCRTEMRRVRMQSTRVLHAVETFDDPEIDETWAVICRLPFRQRAVLALRYYADLSEAEIANILGCRLGTVKSTHHRAIAKLREELEP